jgi:hypothetical protein
VHRRQSIAIAPKFMILDAVTGIFQNRKWIFQHAAFCAVAEQSA